jgi:hypothetical protein
MTVFFDKNLIEGVFRDRSDPIFESRHAARRCRCGYVNTGQYAPSECYSCGYAFPAHVPCPNCCALLTKIPDDRHRHCHVCMTPMSGTTCERLERKLNGVRFQENEVLKASRRPTIKTDVPKLVYIESYTRVDREEN